MPSAKEIRDMSDEELLEHLGVARRELFGLKFQHATGELENTAGLRSARHGLARALTVVRERGLAERSGDAGKRAEGVR